MPTPRTTTADVRAALERIAQAAEWMAKYARSGRLSAPRFGCDDGGALAPDATTDLPRAEAHHAARPALQVVR